MKLCTIIPCRFNSTRFPGKPLEIIGKKPLMYYPYNEALKVKEIDSVFIATDDERISKVCNELKLNYIMTSKDHATGTDRVAEAYEIISKKKLFDMIINVQGDEPFIKKENIEDCINALKNKPEALAANGISNLTSINDITSHSSVKASISKGKKLLYLTRSNIPYPNIRTANIKYYKQLGLYAFRPKALEIFKNNEPSNLEKAEAVEILRLLENDVYVTTFVVDVEGPSVDTSNDLETVRTIYKNKPI